MDIHKRIRLELREVRAVWRRELIRFEETSLPAAQRSVQLAELRRRSLALLAPPTRSGLPVACPMRSPS